MNRSPLASRHEAAGARLLAGPEAGSVLTYGDVPAEYAAAREACALFDATQRGLVRVSGPDRADFLHALLANRVRGLEAGQGNANLLLTSKGKVASVFELYVGPDEIELDTPDPGDVLRQKLDMYHFAEAVELTDASEESAPLELCGPTAGAIVAAALGTAPELEGRAWRRVDSPSGAVRVSAVEVAGSPGWRLDPGPAGATELWDALVTAGARPSGRAVFDILRVESGRPLFGVDIDDNVYPQEAGLESSFSLEKGCYVGQEVVAKIDTYGGMNKKLLPLRINHDDPVPRGTPLLGDDERELGLVTSWAYSFVLDTGLCLGYVKRRHQEPGTVFRLGPDGGQAEVVEAPAPRAGG